MKSRQKKFWSTNIGLFYFTEYSMKMKEMDNYQTSSESDSSLLSKSSKSESMSESFSWVRNNWNDTVMFWKRVYILLCCHMCKYSTAQKQYILRNLLLTYLYTSSVYIQTTKFAFSDDFYFNRHSSMSYIYSYKISPPYSILFKLKYR